MRFKRILFLSGSLLACLNAFAIDNKNLTDTLQEVVVTGTPVRMDRNTVPMSVSIITREEIAASGQSSVLTILNGRIPGLFVTERGITGFGVSNGAAGQISMRGIGGSPTTGVLVMLDGNPQYMGIFGHSLADIYRSSGVERVEVIRGPASMLYGSNAMGGVINILSRRTSKDGFSGEAAARYGSFHTQEWVFTGNYRHRNWNVVTTLNRSSTDGHRANSDFSQNSGYFKVGYRLNDHIRIHTDLNLSHFQATDPGPDTIGAVKGLGLDIRRGSWSASMDHEYANFSGSLRAYRNFGVHDLSNGFHSNDYNNGIVLSETYRPNNRFLIQVGLDGNRYGGKAVQTPPGAVLVDTSVTELSTNGFIRYIPIKRLTVNAGLRVQYNNHYGTELLPMAGLSYDLQKGLTWNTSFGKGFRSPSLRELFMFMDKNRDLLPERVWNYETSLHKTFETMKAHVELTAFYLNGSNLIVGYGSHLRNTGQINNKGLELAAGCEPYKNLQLELTYSHIVMETPAYATPRNHLYLSGMYRTGRFRFHTGLRYVEHLNTKIGPVVESAFQTYALLNAGVEYNLLSNLSLNLSGNNLLNQSYQTVQYYTMPGINGSVGLSYRF